jgi:hypothetical protein
VAEVAVFYHIGKSKQQAKATDIYANPHQEVNGTVTFIGHGILSD